jgi:hypothetical protein
MYIVGQEETVGESSVSVVAGVRTVTTNMDGRDVLPRLSRPFAFSITPFDSNHNALARSLTSAHKGKQPAGMRTSANSNTLSNEALLVAPV